MRIDLKNGLKQVVVVNVDLVSTPLLIDLSQILKCVLTGFLLCRNHATLHQAGFIVPSWSTMRNPEALPWSS